MHIIVVKVAGVLVLAMAMRITYFNKFHLLLNAIKVLP